MFETINNLDLWINQNIEALHSQVFSEVMIVITNLASPLILGTLSVILVFLLLLDKEWNNSVLVVISMTFAFLIEYFSKIFFQRPRPTNALIEMSDFSFPSGHATMSIVFFVLMILIFQNEIKSKFFRYIFVAICTLLFLLIGFSRVYLNAHWLSDVLAGFILGAIVLGLSYLAVNKFSASQSK